ncbi:MAG TPA: hypothetical protein VKV74_18695 [Bryobacteraceae bacterium]|nr:hypothetical protein [Bryobacteraceae bacterium]
METYLVPPHLSPPRRIAALGMLIRGGGPQCDIEIYADSILCPAHGFSFNPDDPDACGKQILRQREDLLVPLARHFFPLRNLAAHHIIRAVSKENAFFSLATALPDAVPGFSLPWAIGEFGSDAAFLTMNQIRMAFLLAACSDRNVGYREQRSEIASIVAGAFGWRALARELVGKIPFGGGLIPKAAVAWAGTFVAGLSLERVYRLGYGFTREERRAAYEQACEHGRQIAGMLLEGIRGRRAAGARRQASA